jgi:hypothetical protein
MTTVKRHISCFCENTFDADLPESADLGVDPEVKDHILDGSFMSVACPACGKVLSPEYPFRLSGVRGLGDICLVPEAERVAYIRGKVGFGMGSPARVVVGFPELMEKMIIAAEGLDDRVIEIMKYYLLTGASNPAGENGDREIVLVYRGREGGRHLFNIMGMKDGEVGVARLAEEFYARIASDVETRVREEPFSDFCQPPWVSLRKAIGGRD